MALQSALTLATCWKSTGPECTQYLFRITQTMMRNDSSLNIRYFMESRRRTPTMLACYRLGDTDLSLASVLG